MSRGGRGRGRGTNKSFSQEQLSSLGVGNKDGVPGPVTQPPPLFPLLDNKPVGLIVDSDLKYQLMLKQDFICQLNDSPAHITLSNKENNNTLKGESQIGNLVAQVPNVKNTFNWALFPHELRPKMIAKKHKADLKAKVDIKPEVDIQQKLDQLEQMEKTTPGAPVVKQENTAYEEEEDLLEEDEDEEMDDGTDYANNYFDNGEAFEDEDDNLEDGPIY